MVLTAIAVAGGWHRVLGGHWLDPAVLLRGAVCAAAAQLGFLCCSAIGGLAAGLQLSDVDFGTGRVRARWLIGRRIIVLRTIPLPVRFGFDQPLDGVPAARRWVVAFVPALVSAAALAVIGWQFRHPDATSPVPVDWLRPATFVAVIAFLWLAVLGGQVNAPSQVANRWVLWHPRRAEHPKSRVSDQDRVHIQRIAVADCRADVATMRAERTALGDRISAFGATMLQTSEWHHEGEYARAAAAVAPFLYSSGREDLAIRYVFCMYTGLAALAQQPIEPDALAHARALCPDLAHQLRRDLAAFVLTVFALLDRDTDLARQFAQQVIRWAPERYDLGEAELLLAIAASMAGDVREARAALRRGRRRAASSPLVAVVERRLAEAPAITVTVDALADD